MAYRVRIYRVGGDGDAVGRTHVYDATTVEEAIALGMSQVRSAPRETDPLVFEIYDPANHLVLSYTSQTQPILASLKH